MRRIPEHTAAVAVGLAVVVALERWWARTGLFRRPSFWISLGICFGFQALVEGLLTRRDQPTFEFSDASITGVRAPWDIPVEDWPYSFSLMALTLILWERARGRDLARGRG